MYDEIGSEFHSTEIGSGTGLYFCTNDSLVFSGRTAIETVLSAISNAKTALLPSYCCDSMIEPFRNAGIKIDFYDVTFQDELKIELKGEADILLWCNYFGFTVDMPDLSTHGITIIEDITHSLFSSCPYHSQSDFLVASLRKWEPIICGGYCAGINHPLKMDDLEYPPEKFISSRKAAMDLKAEYLIDLDKEKKQVFLSYFDRSNAWLEKYYSKLCIDNYSKTYFAHVDVEEQRKIRRENAHALYRGLAGKHQFLFPEERMDCPLFVPIVVSKNRNKVRQKLIEHKIYCPVHWPHPNVACESNLYDLELSLVCDQRYTERDMERIIAVLSD